MKQSHSAVFRSVAVEPLAEGILSGLSFMVKDVFAVKGHTNSAGNPSWLSSHTPAEQHAEAVQLLLQQGAKLSAMTHTDELMYSLNGENVHYGTPLNPEAPDRIPGGSSSGSASAVASGLADFTLGTDTGGSVRVPSAYCGVYGMRPTYGSVSLDGVIPLAGSFDTVGWIARDPELMLKLGRALLPSNRFGEIGFTRMLFPEEAWELADESSRGILENELSKLGSLQVEREMARIAPEGLAEWMSVFRIIQGYEIWQTHGEWIERTKPVFGPDITERFAWARTIEQVDYREQQHRRQQMMKQLTRVLSNGELLVIPTTPGAAPKLGLAGAHIERRRSQTMQLTCIAGLCGLPQLTIPLGTDQGCPLAISVIAGQNQDLRLLEWAVSILPVLKS
ncbi:amidase [Paenibacillus sp. FSL K6-1230]|uniref:amidase n=1 Tax=Paenibacillus sp. FSL K6-1230 TaxID=2921603 RepID=UPI0030F80E4A